MHSKTFDENQPKQVQSKSTEVLTFQPSNKTSKSSSSLNVASKFLIIRNIFSYNTIFRKKLFGGPRVPVSRQNSLYFAKKSNNSIRMNSFTFEWIMKRLKRYSLSFVRRVIKIACHERNDSYRSLNSHGTSWSFQPHPPPQNLDQVIWWHWQN